MKDLFPAWVHRAASWPFWWVGCVAATIALIWGTGWATSFLACEYAIGVIIGSLSLMLLVLLRSFDEVASEFIETCEMYSVILRRRVNNTAMYIGRGYVAAVLAYLGLWSIVGLMAMEIITVIWCLFQMDAVVAEYTEADK